MKIVMDTIAEEQQAHLKLSVTKLVNEPTHILTNVNYASDGEVKSITISYLEADEVETEE